MGYAHVGGPTLGERVGPSIFMGVTVDSELKPVTVEQVRQLFDQQVELPDGTLHPARVSFDRVYVKALLDEVDRLLAGRFTSEELQNLCHSMDETKAVQFMEGCEQYQRGLFGCGAVERERNRCVAIVRAQPVSLSWVRDDIIKKIQSGE